MVRLTTAAAVRERMALLARPVDDTAPTRVGAFTLRAAQVVTVARMLASVRRFGGVLVTDPPGSGKTVLALAAIGALTIRRGETPRASRVGPSARIGASSALVVAPAALRAQWHEAAARAGIAITFASIESFSRGSVPGRAPVVVVDEAHQARTPGTRRHARLAECCLGARVLLLSATPVVNRASDRTAMLSLFLGSRAATLSPHDAARCIVRGADRSEVGDTERSTSRPTVRSLGVLGRAIDVPGLADALAVLPPPVPVVEGSPATALVLMSLALAWRSSLAALDHALVRRLQRGTAMDDLLAAGRLPSRAMLRHWTLHEDSTQLALGALLSEAASSEVDVRAALAAHLDAVASLRDLIRPHRDADSHARADAIRALQREHPGRRIVVFARHARTIGALHTALRADAGVVAIIGSRVRAAAGRWSRDEILRAVGPRARPLRDDDPRAVRILLATDVVAEGVEMQGVGIVVHADLPWTPARLEQRIGRVTRIGSEVREVFEAHLPAARSARRLVRLGARLARKVDARRSALRDARAESAITARLERWRRGMALTSNVRGDPGTRRNAADTIAADTIAAAVAAPFPGFVALVGDPPRWITGVERDGRWTISSAPARVARVLGAAEGDPVPLSRAESIRHARRIARAQARREARHLTEAGGQADAADRSLGSASRRRIARVRAQLARLLATAPSLARGAIAERQAELLERLSRPLELARERRIDALLRIELDPATFARRLGALLSGGTAGNDASRPGDPGRLHALLILTSSATRSPTTAPTAASPGTAAPRRSARARSTSHPRCPGAA